MFKHLTLSCLECISLAMGVKKNISGPKVRNYSIYLGFEIQLGVCYVPILVGVLLLQLEQPLVVYLHHPNL